MLKVPKTNFYLQPLALACAIAFSMSSPSLAPVRAETVSMQSIPLEWRNRESPDFSGDGRPRRTAGGASRSGCQNQNEMTLTALIPNTPIALTVAESPTFWFYVPYALTPEQSVEFVLKDSQNDYVYKTKLTRRETSPGIIGLRLPSTVSLEANQNYDWYFLVYCEPENLSKFVYVNGSVRRVERPYLTSSLEFPSAAERLHFYASEGLWYDAVSHLAQQISANPQDAATKNDWATLLQSVGLEKLIEKPFVSCCPLEQ